MTCGVAQAMRLGMKRVACVSTGNTSASMAAYASAAGLQPMVFIPHGNISYGKLAQALEYGALTLQVEANFDQILKLVRVLAERLGIYLLNSINPFRIEGQKTIMIEMMDQRDWNPPDWIVLPGGNLGNVSAFGKGLRELLAAGLHRPYAAAGGGSGGEVGAFLRLHAASGAWLSRGRASGDARHRDPHRRPGLLAERRGMRSRAPTAWSRRSPSRRSPMPRRTSGCAASAANRLRPPRSPEFGSCAAAGVIAPDADVVAVLTGNVLKDPDYIFKYHTGALKAPDGTPIASTFGNKPVVVPNDPDADCGDASGG